MELHPNIDKPVVPTIVPVAIAAPHPVDGTGSALRRAFSAPGALPDDMLALLRELERTVSRSAAGSGARPRP
ncbi:hypothetical protein [Sphingomonas sp. SUN039]|uniref:hypothetical protein n=1 Tax=Sphingomonas sp. SUN039 TaxID=2937787 RepID=UPI002164996F|nr:hypothetical protein [Sphingomonas sp. SUN039]UVO54444.1 hypothetical protein M0209_10035 [Sphingomonas sp. SUN039]